MADMNEQAKSAKSEPKACTWYHWKVGMLTNLELHRYNATILKKRMIWKAMYDT